MITKKQQKTLSEEVKAILNIFENMKFIRYQEFDFTKSKYFKKIVFSYKNKVSQTFFLTKKDYDDWRKLLNKLVKLPNEK